MVELEDPLWIDLPEGWTDFAEWANIYQRAIESQWLREALDFAEKANDSRQMEVSLRHAETKSHDNPGKASRARCKGSGV